MPSSEIAFAEYFGFASSAPSSCQDMCRRYLPFVAFSAFKSMGPARPDIVCAQAFAALFFGNLL
jgi:hypothetical protein